MSSVVEMLVFRNGVGANESVAANRLRRQAARLGHRLDELQRDGIDTEAVFGGISDEGLGVDLPVEVDVQIGPFGHPIEETAERSRTGFGGFVEGACGAGFAGRRSGWFGLSDGVVSAGESKRRGEREHR